MFVFKEIELFLEGQTLSKAERRFVKKTSALP
jgi:hypothetical protein